MTENKQDLWSEESPLPIYSKLITEVLKFHNKTILINEQNKIGITNAIEREWARNNEFKETLPNIYIDKYCVGNNEENNFNSSQRDFSDQRISGEQFSRLISRSFGSNPHNLSKRYPSAGALYPVVPIIYLFEEIEIHGRLLSKGVYILSGYSSELYLIKKITPGNLGDFIQAFDYNNPDQIPSNYCIGYSIHIKKAVTKYKHRGYRHALMEAGMMAQSFREAIKETKNLGEFSSSAFDDFKVTYLSELNVREAPIVLLQWFGIPTEAQR